MLSGIDRLVPMRSVICPGEYTGFFYKFLFTADKQPGVQVCDATGDAAQYSSLAPKNFTTTYKEVAAYI